MRSQNLNTASCLFYHLTTFSVTPSKVKVRGGSMTTSRQGITMTARLRSPTFQRISVIAAHSESFWMLSAGSSRDFLERRQNHFPGSGQLLEAPHIHWFSPGGFMFQCRLDSRLHGAEEEIFENVGLEDHLEGFLCPRRQSQTKCMNLCWRMEDNATLDPLSIGYTAGSSPTQGLQILK